MKPERRLRTFRDALATESLLQQAPFVRDVMYLAGAAHADTQMSIDRALGVSSAGIW